MGAELCSTLHEANVVVTELRVPQRIEHHVPASERTKPIVSVEWLRDCEAQGVALPYDSYRVYTPAVDSRSPVPAPEAGSRSPVDVMETCSRSREGSIEDDGAVPSSSDWTPSEYAVFRHTPLVSAHNQDLVDRLKVLQRHRYLIGDATSELAYMRAAAAIKAAPFPLGDVGMTQLQRVPGIGPKMAATIRQFYEHGCIAEADAIEADEAWQTMYAFTQLYGVGPHTARRAYQAGCRTLADLARHDRTSLSMQLGQAASLALLPDLKAKLPRDEVQALVNEVMQDVHHLIPDARHEIAGSFRRGAPRCGDVDLVVTGTFSSATLSALLARWHTAGRLSHTVSVSRRRADGASDAQVGMDVAEVVYIHDSNGQRTHRRLDVVLAPPAQFGAALLAWTGSVVYERDLRRWARTQGFRTVASCG
ncbi:DNA-directed DNA polymerase [Malassezia nana]|uniref:DNA polymerase n=1 Tax=Malassezia nana TaxID=180528 RepID=A0AAF0EIR8_9BASI|nr:DNA-directed DNA polymerase [Malassezia nana]